MAGRDRERGKKTNRGRRKRSAQSCETAKNVKRTSKARARSSSNSKKAKRSNSRRKTDVSNGSKGRPDPAETLPTPNPVEELPAPIKSPLDENLYRAIKLPNGLQAIMIIDMGFGSDSEDDEDFNCLDNRVGKFNKEVLGLEKEDCCHCAPKPSDTMKKNSKETKTRRKKRVVKAKNKFCHLRTTTAAVAVSVGVGSYDDPEDLLGLAHLTEHAVFLGSKKHPKPGELDTFLAANNGATNASTDGNNTTFVFSVDCAKLEEALRMFVDFLKNPLLNTNDIVKERDSVVHAEFEDKKIHDDLCRIELLQMTSNAGHPVTRFSWGTKQSLETKDKQDQSLSDRLQAFFRTHYTVDNMTIAIQAPADLHTMERLLLDVFGDMNGNDVPKKPLMERIPPELLNPYDTPEFRKWYKMIPPASDTTQLTLTWSFPSENYRTKSLYLIGHSICSENQGGLAHFLRERYWIEEIEAGPGKIAQEHNEAFTLFYVKFVLTNTGLANMDLILEALFSYVKFTADQSPQEWFCTEHKQLCALAFHFTDTRALDSSDYCKTLASDLRTYGSQDILGGGLLIYDWESQIIETYIAMLKPSTANYMVSSKHFKDCNKIEPYFGTKYSVEDVRDELIKKLENALENNIPLYNEFEPLKTNPFLTTNFCPVRNPDTGVEIQKEVVKVGPHCVVDTERAELWHKLDLEYAADSVYLFELISPLPLESAQSTAMLDLWIFILEWKLRPLTKMVSTAKLNFKISRSYRGVFLELEGLSQKLKLLLDGILGHVHKMSDETTPESFELGKLGQLKEYVDVIMDPWELCRSLKLALTKDTYWIENDLYDAQKSITLEMFQEFCSEFIAELFVLGIAQGNVADSGVKQLHNDLQIILKFEPLQLQALPDTRSIKLPIGTTMACVRNTHKENNNSTTIHIYQIGAPSLEEHAMCLFISDHMFEPAFQQLRVQEGLGYDVDVDCNVLSHMLELCVTVQSHSDKVGSSHVNERIDSFILDFFKDTMERMTESEFANLLNNFGSLDDSVDNNWIELQSGLFKFDRYESEFNILKNSSLNRLREFYNHYFLPKTDGKMRKLCVQVIGDADKEYNTEFIECRRHHVTDEHSFSKRDKRTLCHDGGPSGQASEFPLVFLTPKTCNEKFVSHIPTFKSGLFMYAKTTIAEPSK